MIEETNVHDLINDIVDHIKLTGETVYRTDYPFDKITFATESQSWSIHVKYLKDAPDLLDIHHFHLENERLVIVNTRSFAACQLQKPKNITTQDIYAQDIYTKLAAMAADWLS